MLSALLVSPFLSLHPATSLRAPGSAGEAVALGALRSLLNYSPGLGSGRMGKGRAEHLVAERVGAKAWAQVCWGLAPDMTLSLKAVLAFQDAPGWQCPTSHR